MFKNPLKYASGGAMLPSEQQAENDFISVIAEGLGAQPEQVKARLEQIKSNPTESQQLQEALQLMQQDKNKGFQAVLSLFAGKPQSAKRGGKIQDFICKHARGGQVAGCGCGKPVEKAQGGTSMPYTRGSYQSSDYFNNIGTWIDTPNGLAQNYRPYTFGGRTWGFGGNDLEQILVIPGEYGTPRRAVRRISNWFNPDVPTERLDTTYQDANGNRRNSAEFEARVNRELEGVSGQRPVQKENGGIVKGQNSIPGGMPEIPAENKIYSEKTTMVKGPSIGQRGFGVRRPWLAQTISFNPFSARNDTTYTGGDLQGFIPGYSDDLLKIRYSALPTAVKKNLAKVVDSDYEKYNSTYGSYPNNYYEKTITVKKRK